MTDKDKLKLDAAVTYVDSESNYPQLAALNNQNPNIAQLSKLTFMTCIFFFLTFGCITGWLKNLPILKPEIKRILSWVSIASMLYGLILLVKLINSLSDIEGRYYVTGYLFYLFLINAVMHFLIKYFSSNSR